MSNRPDKIQLNPIGPIRGLKAYVVKQQLLKHAVLATLPLTVVAWLPAYALGLGPAQVGSRLGQPLLLEVPVHGLPADDEAPGCVKTEIGSIDGGAFFRGHTQITANGKTARILVRTGQLINEPILAVSLTAGCDSPVRRDYQILLDLPAAGQSAAPVALLSFAGKEALPEKSLRSLGPVKGTIDAKEAAATGPGQKHASTPKNKAAKTARAQTPSVPQMAIIPPGASFYALRLSTSLTLPAGGLPPPVEPLAPVPPVALAVAPVSGKDQQGTSDAPARKELVLAAALQTGNPNTAVDESLLRENRSLLGWAQGLGAALLASVVALMLVYRRLRQQNAVLAAELDSAVAPHEAGVPNDDEDDDWDHVVPATKPTALQAVPPAPALDEPLKADMPELDWDSGQEKPAASPAAETTLNSESSFHSQLAELVSLEEVDDLVQLAETWLQLNQPEAVIEILGPLNKVEAPNSPLPWLYLLNAYRQLGDRKSFDELYDRVKQNFNVDVPDWGARDALEQPAANAIADYPHIRDNIFAAWNTEDILGYLESLLPDDRSGERQGFPLQVYQDILALIHLASDPKRPIAADGTVPAEVVEIVQRDAPSRGASSDALPQLHLEEMVPSLDSIPYIGRRA
jgi:pilus assembly protein FimV